ncbi:MAG TPA: hypothetical protein VN936_07655, partial [Candidatus Acidoferrum sp.]|nr:hypothetical protein [Candidatus Acidoferrum sp.]
MSTVAHIGIAVSQTQPAGTPVVATVARKTQSINGANISPFGYVTITPDANVTLPSGLVVVWKFPSGATPPDPTHSYLADYDPNNSSTASWNVVAGPATQSTETNGNTDFSFTLANSSVTLVANTTYYLVLFSTTTTLSTPSPGPSSTARPSASPS